MGSHIGGHSDCNSGRSVQKQERKLGREHCRLVDCIVKVWLEIHGVLVEVGKHFVSDFLELGLGISHRGDCISVHRAEVALAIDERVALVPVLGKAHHRVIYAGVTVRVELTEHVSDNPG